MQITQSFRRTGSLPIVGPKVAELGAVSNQADHAGAGKKGKIPSFATEDGTITTVKFETVGGRTSAICSVQKLIKSDKKKRVKATVAAKATDGVCACANKNNLLTVSLGR